MEKMIRLENVSFRYPEKEVFNGLNIEWIKGINVVKGPNGSGKTTLCKIVSGLLKPIEGTVYIDEIDIYGEGGKEVLKNVVYVHDKPVILDRSVYENILIGAKLMGIRRVDIREIIDFFGIKDMLNVNALELSAGYRQLINLLRAFIVKPTYLILDEPFTNLDETHVEKVVKYIVGLSDDITILVATHTNNLDIYAETITWIRNGTLYNQK